MEYLYKKLLKITPKNLSFRLAIYLILLLGIWVTTRYAGPLFTPLGQGLETLRATLPAFLFPLLLFVVALFFLVKCADYFIDFAERLGLKLGIPEFVIGITVIGIGTSLPELATSISTILQSTPEKDITEIITANVIGSNVANILLGVGIASFFLTLRVDRELQDNDLPFLFGSTALAILFLYDGLLTRGEGIVLFALFLVFLLFSIFSGEKGAELVDKELKKKAKADLLDLLLLFLFLSGVGIVISANLTIYSLEEAAPLIGVERDVASMVLLAIGTSFPEIFVTVMAVRKGKAGLAIGNILGSNIGNILGILGISAILTPLVVSEKSVLIGLPFLTAATLFFIFSALDNRFRLWEGIMAVAIFLVFLGKLFLPLF